MQVIKQYSTHLFLSMLFVLIAFAAGCGGGGGGDPILGTSTTVTTTTVTGIAPTVVAVAPLNNESNVSYNIKHVMAEFSVPMDAATLNTTSFTLSQSSTPLVLLTGVVSYANRVADFTLPSDTNLSIDTNYTATITTVAKSADGVALASNYVWTFATGSDFDNTPPEVNSTSPINGAIDVSRSKTVTATFSEAMVSSTITAAGTFTVKETLTPFTVVDGNVSYSVINKIASFNPTLNLASDTNYTATITTAATDLADLAMVSDYNWTFKTANTADALVALVDFGSAATFAIASTAGITNSGATTIDGDVVLNPIYSCNGTDLTADGTFTGCAGVAPTLINPHVVISPVYEPTTPAQTITNDLRAAYISLRDMTGGTEIAAPTTLGSLSTGQSTFTSGVYKSGTSIKITGVLTLQGDENATFVFQSASTIGAEPYSSILLVGGAKASNVYWQVGSSATLGTGTVWNGNTLAYASISMGTGATSCGRLFAGAFTDGAFTFLANKVVVPGSGSSELAGCD